MQISQDVGGFLTPFDFETITVSNVVKKFDTTKIGGGSTVAGQMMGKARLLIVTAEGGDMRYRMDGTAPDPTTTPPSGHFLPSGSSISFANLQSMLNFQVLRESQTDGILQVTYLR